MKSRWGWYFQKLPLEMFPLVEELFPMLLRMLSDASDEVVLLDLEVLSALCAGSVATDFPSSLPPRLADQLAVLPASPSLLPPISRDVDWQDKNPYFVKFAVSLLELFRGDATLLAERGAFILRQLSLLLSPPDIFATLAVLLVEEEDLVWQSLPIESKLGMKQASGDVESEISGFG